MASKIILITGEPGCGKTTLVKNISDRLKAIGFKLFQGFYTEELRDSNRTRIGFDVIDVKQPNKRAALARTTCENESFHKAPKVGKYSVDIKSFESIALPAINSIQNSNIYIIDEIGKMEMFSNSFERSMISLLEQIKTVDCLVLATVPTKSLSLSDKFKNHPLAQLITVNQQNRNTVINEVYNLIKQFISKKITLSF